MGKVCSQCKREAKNGESLDCRSEDRAEAFVDVAEWFPWAGGPAVFVDCGLAVSVEFELA
jgi:hypothetical protein